MKHNTTITLSEDKFDKIKVKEAGWVVELGPVIDDIQYYYLSKNTTKDFTFLQIPSYKA